MFMKKLNLSTLNSDRLTELELKEVRGGKMATNGCGCACKYANQGGSSTSGNGNANHKGGKYSPGMVQETDSFWKYMKKGGSPSECGGLLE